MCSDPYSKETSPIENSRRRGEDEKVAMDKEITEFGKKGCWGP